MEMSIDEILAKGNDAYQKAEVNDNDFSPLPEGDYTLKIRGVKIITKNMKVMWEFNVVGGAYNNKYVNIFTPLEGEHIKFTKMNLSKCECKLENLKELPALLESGKLIGLMFEANVTRRISNDKTYNGVWLNKLIKEGVSELTDLANDAMESQSVSTF